MRLKHLREKKSLILLFAFCAFAWLCLCVFGAFGAFGALVLLVRAKSFRKKKKSLKLP